MVFSNFRASRQALNSEMMRITSCRNVQLVLFYFFIIALVLPFTLKGEVRLPEGPPSGATLLTIPLTVLTLQFDKTILLYYIFLLASCH